MKRILVNTDFTEHSKRAILHVLDMIRDTLSPCQVLFLNTFTVHQTDPKQVMALNDERKTRSLAGLAQERKLALELLRNPQVSVEISSHLGSLQNVLANLADTETSLVVIAKGDIKNPDSMNAILKLAIPLLII